MENTTNSLTAAAVTAAVSPLSPLVASISGGYTVKQIEHDFNIPRSTQYYWQKLKLMPKPIRIGVKKVIYPKEVFDQWLRDRASQSTQAA
jgi:predicted DNA-binding transcriptional regulator AlpA